MMIIITGSNGKLGQEIIAALLKRTSSENIVAAARDTDKLGHHEKDGIGVRHADYDDSGSLDNAFQGIDTLILIPSAAPIEQRMQQNRNVISAAQSCGISHIIFLSLLDVAEDSPLPYAKAFLDTEKALSESGIPCTKLRMSLYMDNFLDWPPFQVRDNAITLSAGDARVGYISRSDLADAAAAVAIERTHKGGTFEMTGPASLSYGEVTNMLSKIRGESIHYNPVTPEEHYNAIKGSGLPEYLLQGSLGMAATTRQGAFDRVTSHVEELTGHKPEDFLSFLRRKLQ